MYLSCSLCLTCLPWLPWFVASEDASQVGAWGARWVSPWQPHWMLPAPGTAPNLVPWHVCFLSLLSIPDSFKTYCEWILAAIKTRISCLSCLFIHFAFLDINCVRSFTANHFPLVLILLPHQLSSCYRSSLQSNVLYIIERKIILTTDFWIWLKV